MKKMYKARTFYKDAPLSTWSVTQIDHLGVSVCFDHFATNQPAVDYIDELMEQLEEAKEVVIYKVMACHHYGPCVYCGVDANNREGSKLHGFAFH